MTPYPIIGIDCGKEGAIAIIDEMVAVRPVPTIARPKGGKEYDVPGMADRLRGFGSGAHAFIEDVQAMPAQGRTSCITIGRGQGCWAAAQIGAGTPAPMTAARRGDSLCGQGLGVCLAPRGSAR